MTTKQVRVLVVDDSAAMRQLLKSILTDGGLDVVGVAKDPLDAREKIKQLDPDVITLDVEMPRMDGLTFLEKLMRLHPMPVIMVSSLTQKSADATFRALELGAIDFVAKPAMDTLRGLQECSDEIVSKVKAAAGAHVGVGQRAVIRPAASGSLRLTNQLIAIGASTGGTEAIREVIQRFPAGAPPTVIVQHMPPGFTASFADRLNGLCAVSVREATDRERVLPGNILIAPGDKQMEVLRDGAEFRVRVFDGEPVNRHKPSVDVLFDSCAKSVCPNAIGVILTGMGADGARGMKRMRDAGARTIAQDEASCVVFGMPREAIHMGGAEMTLPLDQVADQVLCWATKLAA